jgi:hypothetical protein
MIGICLCTILYLLHSLFLVYVCLIEILGKEKNIFERIIFKTFILIFMDKKIFIFQYEYFSSGSLFL